MKITTSGSSVVRPTGVDDVAGCAEVVAATDGGGLDVEALVVEASVHATVTRNNAAQMQRARGERHICETVPGHDRGMHPASAR
jgi:hypothetical protein